MRDRLAEVCFLGGNCRLSDCLQEVHEFGVEPITFTDKNGRGLEGSSAAIPGFELVIFRQEVAGPYRSTRCSTTGMLDGRCVFGLLDGSDPSDGGPIAGRGPVGSPVRGDAMPGSTVRCSSI
jgi:hypothetical protein